MKNVNIYFRIFLFYFAFYLARFAAALLLLLLLRFNLNVNLHEMNQLSRQRQSGQRENATRRMRNTLRC